MAAQGFRKGDGGVQARAARDSTKNNFDRAKKIKPRK